MIFFISLLVLSFRKCLWCIKNTQSRCKVCVLQSIEARSSVASYFTRRRRKEDRLNPPDYRTKHVSVERNGISSSQKRIFFARSENSVSSGENAFGPFFVTWIQSDSFRRVAPNEIPLLTLPVIDFAPCRSSHFPPLSSIRFILRRYRCHRPLRGRKKRLSCSIIRFTAAGYSWPHFCRNCNSIMQVNTPINERSILPRVAQDRRINVARDKTLLPGLRWWSFPRDSRPLWKLKRNAVCQGLLLSNWCQLSATSFVVTVHNKISSRRGTSCSPCRGDC